MRLEALSGTPLGTNEQQFAYAGGNRLPQEMPILFQVHGQRVLDVALSEWTAPEPEVARYAAVSVYSYVGGDPVNRNDVTGRSWGGWGSTDPPGNAVTQADLELNYGPRILERDIFGYPIMPLINDPGAYMWRTYVVYDGKIREVTAPVDPSSWDRVRGGLREYQPATQLVGTLTPIGLVPANYGVKYKRPRRGGSTQSQDPQHVLLSVDGFVANSTAQGPGGNCPTCPERPDADGRLTFEEARNWYLYGGGRPLTVDLSSLELSWVRKSDFKNGDFLVHLDGPRNILRGNINDGLVYGRLTLRLNPSGESFSVLYDDYDFEFNDDPARNIYVGIGRIANSGGIIMPVGGIPIVIPINPTPYRIYFRGSIPLTN